MVVNHDRKSGILLHPTALPGPYGIGEIGPHAYRFVDHLSDMGQTLWQILPIGPTDFHNSPYSSMSTFEFSSRKINQHLSRHYCKARHIGLHQMNSVDQLSPS